MSKSEKIKQLEFSKKLAVWDVIIYAVLMVTLIAVMFFRDTLAQWCVQGMTIVATAFTSVHLGYSAKAAVENTKKIQALMKADELPAEAAENLEDNG